MSELPELPAVALQVHCMLSLTQNGANGPQASAVFIDFPGHNATLVLMRILAFKMLMDPEHIGDRIRLDPILA